MKGLGLRFYGSWSGCKGSKCISIFELESMSQGPLEVDIGVLPMADGSP